MKKAFLIMLVVVMVASIGLVGCGNNEEPAEDAVQEFHYFTNDEPLLDPQAAQYSYEFEIMNNIYEGLLRVGPDQKYQLAMAESYDVSEDGLTWTFTIRDDANWSDGSPVTAADFVYGLNRATSDALASIYAFIVSDYVADAKALDEKTLEITWTKVIPYNESLLAFATYYPVKEEFVTTAGESFGKDTQYLLFNGPFKVTEWQHDQKLVLEKNENYWDKDTVKLNKITLDIIKDDSVMLNLYLTGELDRITLARENVNIYKNDPAFADQFSNEAESVMFWLMFNTENDVLANENIRKAMSYGFDRQNYCDIVLNNGSIPAYGLVPPGMPGPENSTFREANGDLVSYDPELAKQYLATGLEELKLDKLPTLVYLSADSELNIKGSEFIQEMYRQSLGIDIQIDNVPVATVKERRKAGDFDLFFGGWGPDYWDPMTFMDLFLTGGTFNEGHWTNAEYDELVKFAQTSADFPARMDALLDAEKILITDDAGIAPVFYRGRSRLTQPYLQDFVAHPFGADSSWKWMSIVGKEK